MSSFGKQAGTKSEDALSTC